MIGDYVYVQCSLKLFKLHKHNYQSSSMTTNYVNCIMQYDDTIMLTGQQGGYLEFISLPTFKSIHSQNIGTDGNIHNIKYTMSK